MNFDKLVNYLNEPSEYSELYWRVTNCLGQRRIDEMIQELASATDKMECLKAWRDWIIGRAYAKLQRQDDCRYYPVAQ